MGIHKTIALFLLAAGLSSAGQMFRNAIVPRTLYYTFNGDATTSNGDNYPILTNNNSAIISGVYGEAISFTGAGNSCLQNVTTGTFPMDGGGVNGQQKFWFHFWAKTTYTGTDYVWQIRSQESSLYQIRSSFESGYIRYSDYSSTALVVATAKTNDGNWHCYDLVTNGYQSRSIYIDGVFNSSSTMNAAQLWSTKTVSFLRFGASTTCTLDNWPGSIDDWHFSNGYVPSAGLIGSLYAEQKGRYSGDE